jgi:hypothetical protein
MPKISVAVAWLRKEDWPRWQAIDSQLPSYDNWLRKIEALIKEAEKRGQLPEKVIVEPDVFLNWCKATGCEVNRNTRAQFAASLLMRRKHESH